MRILVAALDWGLGHAARCITLIEAFEKDGKEVVLGAAGRAAALWKATFPHLPQVSLPAYNIRYPFANMYANMLLQGPRISAVALAEHLMLRQLVAQWKFDAIISDNRFGCFHPDVRSIYITHQIHIPLAQSWAKKRINTAHHALIRRYDECWIPDMPDEADSIAGQLSHPAPAGHSRYIGPLSRLKPGIADINYQTVVLLSGPEPQRTFLEAQVCRQAALLPGKMLIVQGKPENTTPLKSMPRFDIVPHLPAGLLAGAIAGAQLLVARSGYSTLMDFASMGKPALLIPTPGQPEQQYLADYWQQKGWANVQQQAVLDFSTALAQAVSLVAPQLQNHEPLLLEAVRSLNN